MVEELLQFFICKINAQLFKSIEIKNFKTSNIKDTNEEGSWRVFSLDD